MAAVDVYGPSLTEKDQQGGAVGIQQFHGSGIQSPTPTTNPGAVGRTSTVNDIVDRLINSAGNTYRQAQPAAVGDPTAGTGGWKEAVDYAMGQLSNRSWMNLGRGGRRGANAAAELGAIMPAVANAYGSEVGARGQFAGQQVAGNAAVAKGQMEFGEKQLGTAAVLNDSNVNAQYYNELGRLKGVELAEEKRWHDQQFTMGMDRNKALRDGGYGGGGGAVSKQQKADRKAVEVSLTKWNRGKEKTLAQEAKDTKDGGAVGPGYQSMRKSQNKDREAYQKAMQEYHQKYGEVYTGGGDVVPPGAVAPRQTPAASPRQVVPAERKAIHDNLRSKYINPQE